MWLQETGRTHRCTYNILVNKCIKINVKHNDITTITMVMMGVSRFFFNLQFSYSTAVSQLQGCVTSLTLTFYWMRVISYCGLLLRDVMMITIIIPICYTHTNDNKKILLLWWLLSYIIYFNPACKNVLIITLLMSRSKKTKYRSARMKAWYYKVLDPGTSVLYEVTLVLSLNFQGYVLYPHSPTSPTPNNNNNKKTTTTCTCPCKLSSHWHINMLLTLVDSIE